MKRYSVFQRDYRKDVTVFVGYIMARNYSHAQTKAQQLYNRHSWAEYRHADNAIPA